MGYKFIKAQIGGCFTNWNLQALESWFEISNGIYFFKYVGVWCMNRKFILLNRGCRDATRALTGVHSVITIYILINNEEI